MLGELVIFCSNFGSFADGNGFSSNIYTDEGVYI